MEMHKKKMENNVMDMIMQEQLVKVFLELDGLELSFRGDVETMAATMGAQRFSMIRSSDSHRLSELAQTYTVLEMEAPTVEEIRKALNGEAGRRIVSLEVDHD